MVMVAVLATAVLAVSGAVAVADRDPDAADAEAALKCGPIGWRSRYEQEGWESWMWR